MNIWAAEGHKIKVTERSARNGYKCDSDLIKKLDMVNKEFTVSCTVVHNSSTEVYLKEFPGERFNSVNFEDAVEQSEEKDREHLDWNYYN